MIGCNDGIDSISTHFLTRGIVLEGKVKVLNEVFRLVDLYESYGDKKC